MSRATRTIGRKLNLWRRPLHISWLLAWAALASIVGIALAGVFFKPAFANFQVMAASGGLLAIVLAKRPTTAGLVVMAVITGLLLGLWRGENQRLETAGYQVFIGRQVRLEGIIADDTTSENGATGMKLGDVRVNRVRLDGKVWASASTDLHLKRNDRVGLKGTLRSGFGSYAASMSFAKITSALRRPHADLSREIRDAFDTGLKRTVPQPEAALATGYLTGQHNEVPDSLIKQMQITGLIHLVIAGGYNVTILVRLVRRAGARISKRLAALASASVLFGLMLVAGFVAPMARTTIVTGLSLVAWYCGRWPHPLVLLPVSAAITAFIDPLFVWGDVGWYMTFVAYGGLIVLGPMLKRWWWGNSNAGAIKQIVVDTVSVQIVATPLMAFAFQQYSIYGLPANLLVLPFMSLTMVTAVIAGLSGMFLPEVLAHWMSWPANVLLGYVHEVTVWVAGAPGADMGGGLSAEGLVLSYVAVLLFIGHLKRKTGYDFRSENLVE